MGCYILNVETHPTVTLRKPEYLVDFHRAVHIHEPTTFEGCPPGHVYINVIDNVNFEAAFVVLTAEDFRTAKYDSGRRTTWLLMPVEEVRPLVMQRYLDEPALRLP